MRYRLGIAITVAIAPMAYGNDVQNLVNSIHEKNKNAPAINIESMKMPKQEQLELEKWLKGIKERTPDIANTDNPNRPLSDGKKVDIDAVLARYNKVQKGMNNPDDYSTFVAMVSLSMPENALVNIIRNVHKAGGRTVIRGLVDNSFKKTTLRMREIISKAGVGNVNIDPRIFKTFDIQKTPTFIVIKVPITNCLDKNCTTPPVYDKWVGNIDVATILEQFALSGDTSAIAGQHLLKLQGDSHD